MKSLLFLVAAAASLESTAFAQVDGVPAASITPADLRGGGYARSGYGQRTDAEVFSIGNPMEVGGGFFAGGTSVYDDVTFGAQGASGAVTLNGIAFGIAEPTDADARGDHLYMRLSFFPNHANYGGATEHPYSGTPVAWNLDIGSGWSSTPGYLEYFGVPWTFTNTVRLDSTNVFTSPDDRTCGVYIELFTDAAMTTYAAGWALGTRYGYGVPLIGSTDSFAWYGSSSNPAPDDITNAGRHGTEIDARAVYLKLQGTGYGVPPPPSTPLGCIPDTGLVRTGDSIAVGHVNWYSFCLPTGAQDALRRFLDIDAEGSQADATMGLYDSNGTQVGLDYDSGSGLNPQLSFGIGRRAAVLDGRQYDGRNGQLVAGTYYLAVAPVTSGPITVRFATNVNGAPLAPSVAPIPDDDLDTAGPIVSPGRAIPPHALAALDVRWARFTTCRPSSDQTPVVIDMEGTDAPGSSQILFDSAGNLVGRTQSDSGAAPPLVFDSSNVLAAGVYYLAQTYRDSQIAPFPATDGRWHVREILGPNGFSFAGTIHVGWPTCGQPPCSRDFNGDGDDGTDADIEAFFACIAGNCCASCGSADFNGDGDTATDADIESFFRVLAGGPC